MTVQPNEFVEFFREAYRDPATGQTFDPFPWQVRLASRVCAAGQEEGGEGVAAWPAALALPTGSGKTTCVDIAVFALACQADRPTGERTAPRRILFVVDRRVIVDEAFRHALELAGRLHEATEGILRRVADALRRIAGSDTPLTCHQLRGGMYRDDAWARSPAQPCVIASTVDQIGSRLLFRAYGRSFKSWPVHAGLAGNDALILLDEAHCANPFLQTVRAVARYRRLPWAETSLLNPFHVVVLSATPPADCGEVFSAEEDDRRHPVLGPRLNASKPTRLVVASKAKGSAASRELAVVVVEQAIELVSEQRRAVAILVNRVQTARLVDSLLASLLDKDDHSSQFDSRIVKRLRKSLSQKGVKDLDHVLMTGRMRPIDRQEVTDQWLERLSARGAGGRQLDRPVFVTATQCLEVGADLDFDAMVSECASLDALRQRFGRLNRTGRGIEAAGAIVVRQDQVQAGEPDPIYGEALAATWKRLNEWAADGLVDLGVAVVETRWQELSLDEQSKLVPPAPDAPILLPAHVDCWVQTSPEPEPTPDVSIFLHGPQHGAPEIQVCWRADLPEHGDWPRSDDASNAAKDFERNVIDAVSLCPPTTLECLTVPRHLFLRWWAEMTDEVAGELADVESAGTETAIGERRQKRAVGLIWRGPRDSRLLRDPGDLRPGDTVVLPNSIGGWDVLGCVPLRPGESIDAAERCHWQARRKAVVRLRADWLDGWPETEAGAREALKEALTQLAEDPDAGPDREQLLQWLHDIASQEAAPAWLRETVKQGLPVRSRPEVLPHPFGGLVVRGRVRAVPSDRTLTASETFTTEDDTASATEQVTLEQHGRAVAKRARHYAELCGLERTVAATLELAGLLHDLGKADRRYQAFLFGGNRRVAELAAEVYAKSAGLRDNRRSYDDAWTAAGLPDEFRHEMLSVQLVEHCWGLVEQWLGSLWSRAGNGAATFGGNAARGETIDRDLLVHLIAMHHGYGRPLAPVVFDEASEEQLALWLPAGEEQIEVPGSDRRCWPPPHRLDSGVPERFWRLVRRYGWWGLAWLEAIFVLADHRTSEGEAQSAMQQNQQHSQTHRRTAGVRS